jgi:hypothetical protein
MVLSGGGRMPFDPIYIPDLGEVEYPVFSDSLSVDSVAEKLDPHFTHPQQVQWCGECADGANGRGRLDGKGQNCHYFRACKKCMRLRAQRYYAQTLSAINDKNIKGVKIMWFDPGNEKLIERMVRRLHKDAYLRFPQVTGEIAIMVGINEVIEKEEKEACQGQHIYEYDSKASLEGIDFDQLLNTPWPKSVSGKLAEMVKVKQEHEIVADVTTVFSDADASTRILAFEAAVKDTPEIPKTVEELPELLRIRNDRYAFYLSAVYHANTLTVGEHRALRINSILVNGKTEIEWLTIPKNTTITQEKLCEYYANWNSAVSESLVLHAEKLKTAKTP